MELYQLGPLVTVGIITAVRVIYLLRGWHQSKRPDSARAAKHELQLLPGTSLTV
jgi:hypothetical protein